MTTLKQLPKRNIPAHAGKTGSAVAIYVSFQEHPRARGENAIAPATSALIGGTSPRTRGKLHGQLGADVDIRNIPAHAGKTI